ncbi:helix-turn-helix transcriptional regulator [Cohnella xylanilytica]|uniref:Helix-turn-helix transcriptional regulator n=1 Tax=Cohnella xylanilytica TaxID=557555 RepID=A0A841TVD3_9BACL|nr:helix-turn-helix transcriptional regulator [Cohnella xylanilytica]MBB6689951.1 helix-turn-helix transcriptional regulator [Cohnella xylanilytica]
MSSFGQRLRELRGKMTQSEFSKLFKISDSAVGMYERNEREPSFQLINEIADYFGVSVDYLMGRSNSRTSNVVMEQNSPHGIDPEINELLEKIRQKGIALEATALLRSASKMNKEQLMDILKVFEMIEKDKQ